MGEAENDLTASVFSWSIHVLLTCHNKTAHFISWCLEVKDHSVFESFYEGVSVK